MASYSIDCIIDSFPLSEEKSNNTIKFKVLGPPSLQTKLNKLLQQNITVFSLEVKITPAILPPLDLQVEMQQWDKNENSLPPRVLSANKQLAVHEMVYKLLRLKVIRASQAHRYSQVTLVPKTDSSWRMCIDYRRLNRITNGLGWPLPNIVEMLRRIGQNKPKFFATMDLTSGYHQMPMSASSIKYTAFITFMGVFEWLRYEYPWV